MSILRLSLCLQTAGSYLRTAADSIFSSNVNLKSSSLPLNGLYPTTTGACAAYSHSSLLPSSSRPFASAVAPVSAAAFGSMGISADERPFAWLLADSDWRSAKAGGDPAADGGTAAEQQVDAVKPHRTRRITEIRGPYHDVIGRRRLSVRSCSQRCPAASATCCLMSYKAGRTLTVQHLCIAVDLSMCASSPSATASQHR